jgi:histone H3/H4
VNGSKKKSGAWRISADATTTLADLMEEYGAFLARQAKKMSDPAGRKTVMGSDISMAVKCSNNGYVLPILENSPVLFPFF